MFKVYSSSAGSGKTYTLTKEYLKLALHTNSDTYYKHILAITFTNAAANEMKSRILGTLRTIAETELPLSNAHSMFRDVVTELYPETLQDEALFEQGCQLIAARAQVVFYKVLHRYSDFAVMTIDKFTKGLVSSFTDELGLPFVFETQLDADLLDEAIDRLLARIGQDGEHLLTNIVENYYRERAEEGASWGALPDTIRATSSALLQEEAYLNIQKIGKLTMEDWSQIRKNVRQFSRDQESLITMSAAEAKKAIDETGLVEKDFFQGKNGVGAYFEQRSEGAKLWAAPNSYVIKAMEEDVWYGARAPVGVKDRIDGIKSVLFECFSKIESIRIGQAPKVLLYQALDKHLYSLSLLGEIRKEFDRLLRDNNQVHISDFNRRIAEIVSNEPVPFIYERLGEKYNHILLDEFQDTSKLQFANLIPLIENALGEGHFNLVVGDAKQAIYRFRGGDMDLILHLSQDQVLGLTKKLGDNPLLVQRLESIGRHLDVAHLRTNRRSYREITEFNNDFFSCIADDLGKQHPVITTVFDAYFQQEIPVGVKSGGTVKINFYERGSSDDESQEQKEKDAILEGVVERVQALRSQGYEWRDVAILCRTRKHAAQLASALQQEGFPLISDDALTLAYSRHLQFVITILKVLLTPDDSLARYEALYIFHHQVLGKNPDSADMQRMRQVADDRGMDQFLTYFEQWEIKLTAFKLRQASVLELAELIMRDFGLFDLGTEDAYLFRFLDMVLEFGTGRSSHLGDFLAHWDLARYKISINVPEGTNALRITTIHKSKGLEYPVVIVPYADWKVIPRSGEAIWVDLQEEPDLSELEVTSQGVAKKLLSSMISIKKDLSESTVQKQLEDHEVRTIVENLNLLYVAFTRPVQALYILASRPPVKGPENQINGWLYNYLNRPGAVPHWEEEVMQYDLFQGAGAPEHAHIKNTSESYILRNIISNDPGKNLRLRRQADRIFDLETFEIRNDLFQKTCYLITRLRNIDDLEHAIQKIVSEGVLRAEDQQNLKYLAENILGQQDLVELYDPALSVKINKEVLLPGGTQIHVDRIVEMPGQETVFMRFLPLNRANIALKSLQKLVEGYQLRGKSTRAVLVVVENQQVIWVED